MKNFKTLAAATALGLAISGFAIAQSHDSDHHADPAAVVKHLAEAYPKVASFDANHDGKLDATEKESLAKAIVDGTLELPAHTPPHQAKPSADTMLTHIADMYALLAKYDA